MTRSNVGREQGPPGRVGVCRGVGQRGLLTSGTQNPNGNLVQRNNSPTGWIDDDLWNPGPGSIGSAHAVSSDAAPRTRIEALHATVEEVTGQPVEQPAPRKIGFY